MCQFSFSISIKTINATFGDLITYFPTKLLVEFFRWEFSWFYTSGGYKQIKKEQNFQKKYINLRNDRRCDQNI